MGFWIRIWIHIENADPDSEGEKSDQKRRKINSEDQQKIKQNRTFYSVKFWAKNLV
jgi:hypothetical protein